ncbi:MAG: hypothetical protein S4CHLAM20_07440 [Chlamydiia bacterium]|nr:hypothetical protein [Chlamydiia bacterium]
MDEKREGLTITGLELAITEFKQVLESNLKSKNINHLEVMSGLIIVLVRANTLLERAKGDDEKAKIFDILKTLDPFFKEHMNSIINQMKMKEKNKEMGLALVLFDQQQKVLDDHIHEWNEKRKSS